MATKITKKVVDALIWEPGGPAQQFLFDTDLKGFGIYVLESGRKVYIAQYRVAGRKQRDQIGQHGVLTPEQARDAARRILAQVAMGEDPAAGKRAAKAARTLSDVAEEWLANHVEALKKPKTAADYRRTVAVYIVPKFGRRPLRDLTRADVSALRAQMRDTPAMANNTLATLSSLWSYAVEIGEVEEVANPCRGIERYRIQGKERYLTTEELARIGDVLREAETIGLPWEVDEAKPKAKHLANPENRREVLDPYAVAAIRLLLLTGARVSEILGAQWSWVDWERGILFLPDSKTGRKPIYLSAAAQAVLSALPRMVNNPHIIVGALPGAGRKDLKKPWAAVRRAAAIPDVRLHDMRHSFASVGAGASLGLPIIGKLLGHTQPQTTARYAHLDADPLRRAVEAIGNTIAAAMDGATGENMTPLGGDRNERS